MYVPRNVPVEMSKATRRTFAFGQAKSGDEAIAPGVEGEKVNDGVGNRDERSGDVDGTTSGGSVDSKRVKPALLTAGSQLTCYRSKAQGNSLPVSSWPPTNHAEPPYGPARRQRQREMLKIKRINDKKVSQTQQAEMTHQIRASAAQPPDILLQHSSRVAGPIRQRGHTKIAPIKVSQMQNSGNAYLARTHAVQPRRNPSKLFHRVYTPIRRRGRPTIERINISPTRNGETAYLGRDPIAQPRGDDPQRSYMVIGPKRRRGQLKIAPTNVSRRSKERNAYLGLYKPKSPLPLEPDDPSRSTPIGHLLYSLQSLKNDLQKVNREDDKSIASKYAPECKQINNAQRVHRGHVTYQIR